MKNARWKPIALAVAALLVVVVILQNTETVQTRFLFFSLSMPHAVLLFVTLLVGLALGLLGGRRFWREAPRKER